MFHAVSAFFSLTQYCLPFFDKECEEISHGRGQQQNCWDPICHFIIAVVNPLLMIIIIIIILTDGIEDESSKGKYEEGRDASDEGENPEGRGEMLQTKNIDLEDVLLYSIRYLVLQLEDLSLPARPMWLPARLRGRIRTCWRRWRRTRSRCRTSSGLDRSLLNIISMIFPFFIFLYLPKKMAKVVRVRASTPGRSAIAPMIIRPPMSENPLSFLIRSAWSSVSPRCMVIWEI